MEASFAKFSYVELYADQRNFVRMVPDPLSPVIINSPLGVIEGEVQDVSLTGVGILIHQSCPLETGAEMAINFVLKNIGPSAPIKVNLPARLISISGDSLPRKYKFAITPDNLLERQLSQYIIQRQIEIIKEVKAAVV